jgi:hypothetical protein
MLQQQGVTPNIIGFLDLVALYQNMPEVNQIINVNDALGGVEGGPVTTDKPLQSPVTHRINERISRPGMTRQGHDQIMQQMMAGSSMQPSQQAAAQRPIG